ncbi:glycerophosphodiester phosphodiesterase [Parabacteroides chinchillae]
MKTYLILIISLLSVFISEVNGSNIDRKYRLIAHRGGVTENGLYPENSIGALDEAIKRGYTGVEIDVRQSKDGKLFLYHNRTFEQDYDSKATGSELTWAEIQALRPLKRKTNTIVSMEDYCNHCKGKIEELMIDIKIDKPSLEFYQELERILSQTGYLKSSYFIGHGNYFKGKSYITMLIREKDEFFKADGEKTKDYYFLFAGIDELNSRIIQWCKKNNIKIMACVNRPYRVAMNNDNLLDAKKDIEWLQKWGVVDYQIDTDYDLFFREDD